jgi:hypothetical protein
MTLSTAFFHVGREKPHQDIHDVAKVARFAHD